MNIKAKIMELLESDNLSDKYISDRIRSYFLFDCNENERVVINQFCIELIGYSFDSILNDDCE